MFTRIITYDLSYADPDDYQDLYDLLGQYKAEQITESTYKIVTTDSWNDFSRKFYRVTGKGDIVKAIVLQNGAIRVWDIR